RRLSLVAGVERQDQRHRGLAVIAAGDLNGIRQLADVGDVDRFLVYPRRKFAQFGPFRFLDGTTATAACGQGKYEEERQAAFDDAWNPHGSPFLSVRAPANEIDNTGRAENSPVV